MISMRKITRHVTLYDLYARLQVPTGRNWLPPTVVIHCVYLRMPGRGEAYRLGPMASGMFLPPTTILLTRSLKVVEFAESGDWGHYTVPNWIFDLGLPKLAVTLYDDLRAHDEGE